MPFSAALLMIDRIGYEPAWTLQRRLVEERRQEAGVDTLLLVEHDPVFTIGRTGRASHWGNDESRLAARGYPVYHVERGGSITYHGPGQIVGYPILLLARFCSGPKAYIGLLETVLIRTLEEWGIPGERREKLPGVWVRGERASKIAAMGVRIQRGVTMHGFALNVSADLGPFREIVPCGIDGVHVTSMTEILGRHVDSTDVRGRIAAHFAEIFALEWTADMAGSLPASEAVPQR
jgi:lipoyl(octanoyl) transferase